MVNAAFSSLILLSGCGHGALFVLFTSNPDFLLTASSNGAGEVLLTASEYDEQRTENDPCDADSVDSCENDYFRGFAFYRSDSGAYGEFIEIGRDYGPTFIDTTGGPDIAWRAAILRERADDDLRIDSVSTAAQL